MNLRENHFSEFYKYPIIELDNSKLEQCGEKREEWQSADGKKKIVINVMGGGTWGEMWLREIVLFSTDNLVGGELMRLQTTKNVLTKEIVSTIYVDAFRLGNGFGYMESFCFASDNEGLREETGKITLPNHMAGTKDEDYLEAMLAENVLIYEELPKQIDVEETARLFLEQLEDRVIARPVLVKA